MESIDQYDRLAREEAAARARDIERTLQSFGELERRRGELMRQTLHDLGGNAQAVNAVVDLLGEPGLSEEEKTESVNLLVRSMETLRSTVKEMMDLTPLEAGQEKRDVSATFDAAEVLSRLADGATAFARQRNLYVRKEGATPFPVQGDPVKVGRIAQNLIYNALKYTEAGGVTVSWEVRDEAHWQFVVRDTGPGLQSKGDSRAALAESLGVATAAAQEAAERENVHESVTPKKSTAEAGQPPEHPTPSADSRERPGEGIGLSIVKRLCELLDASLELESQTGVGTKFCVVLPWSYPAAVA